MLLSKKNRGSLTIEAALVLPFVILVILTIAYFIRVAYIHSIIQHALSDSGKELSTYSYLYSVSKLQKLNDSAEDTLSEKEGTAVSHMDTAIESITSLNEKFGDVKEKVPSPEGFDIDYYKNTIKDGKADIDSLKALYDDVKGHPKGWKGGLKKEVISFASLASHGLFESGKGELTGIVVKILMRKHIATDKLDENNRLLKLNVIGGYEGLDFSGTSLFKDKKTIDIVVSYSIKPLTPIKAIPEIRITQRAVVKGWLSGDGKLPQRNQEDDSLKDSSDNIWELDPLDRGKEILRRFGSNVKNRTGGAVDVFEISSKTAINIRSIDVTLPSYSDLEKLKKEIKSEIVKLVQYNGQVTAVGSDSKESKNSISSKNVRILIPKGTKSNEITSIEKELGSLGVNLSIEEYMEKKNK